MDLVQRDSHYFQVSHIGTDHVEQVTVAAKKAAKDEKDKEKRIIFMLAMVIRYSFKYSKKRLSNLQLLLCRVLRRLLLQLPGLGGGRVSHVIRRPVSRSRLACD